MTGKGLDVSSAVASVSGPLKPYADGFAAVLVTQGYAAGTVMRHRQLMGHLSRWLEAHELGADALGEVLIEEFLAERHAAGRQASLRIGSFAPLLAYLRGVGVIGAPHDVPVGEIDAMLVRFAGYLAKERALRSRRSRCG
jgi:hypothetical protein